MTSTSLLSRPNRSHRMAIAASTALVALALTACREAQPQPQATTSPSAPSAAAPSQSAPTGGATPTVAPAQQTVFGRLTVTFAKTTSASVVPRQPISYRLGARKSGSATVTNHPLGAADRHRTASAARPATGCIYGGHVDVLYGRVVSGDKQRRTGIVQKLSAANKQGYHFIYLPNGGLIITGAMIDIPAAADRPEAARNCVVEEFTSVPA